MGDGRRNESGDEQHHGAANQCYAFAHSLQARVQYDDGGDEEQQAADGPGDAIEPKKLFMISPLPAM